MGGRADPDHHDRGCGRGCENYHQSWNLEGSVLASMGVVIEVKGLNAWYGKNLSLKSIDMTVQANHVTAVIGPSGCGKSTFVRCLHRMHETLHEARAEGLVKAGGMEVY